MTNEIKQTRKRRAVVAGRGDVDATAADDEFCLNILLYDIQRVATRSLGAEH